MGCRATVRGVELRQIRRERMALGVDVVRGIIWPTGERFAATLWAISAGGGAPGEQVVYTDRGHYRTGKDVYALVREGVFDGVWVNG